MQFRCYSTRSLVERFLEDGPTIKRVKAIR